MSEIYVPYLQMVQIDDEAQQATGYPSSYLLAQQQSESETKPGFFGANVVSSAGAIGVAQFEPATAAEWGVNPTNPLSSAIGQAKYMQYLDKINNGNETAALNEYNGNGYGTEESAYSSAIEAREKAFDKNVGASFESMSALNTLQSDASKALGLAGLPPQTENKTSATVLSDKVPAEKLEVAQTSGWSWLGLFLVVVCVMLGVWMLGDSLVDKTVAPAAKAASSVVEKDPEVLAA